MTRRDVIRYGGWAALTIVVIGLLGVIRLSPAVSAQARVEHWHAQVMRDTQRIEVLRQRTRTPTLGRRPDGDLITRAQRALVSAGLPAAACNGVDPRGDQMLQGTSIKVQMVQVRLKGLRPNELGAWLAAWRTADQPWSVGEIQMTHAQGSDKPERGSGSLDNNRFDINVLLAAPYLEETS